MFRSLLLAATILFCGNAFSQRIPLINSGKLIETAKTSYDSGNFERAVKLYLAIPERDTNYYEMLPELAITYLAQKEYDKALETCEKGLSQKHRNRLHMLRSKAIALDKKGDYKKSIEVFESALKQYPTDPVLAFNYGITLFAGKDYEKAQAKFFHALSINPFHSGSHRALAGLAILQGKKVHAMLSMGIYLSINPEDNQNLVLINNAVTNQVSDESTVEPFGFNAYEKLDQAVRAKLALEKSFKSKFEDDFAIIRQFELVFQQLELASNDGSDQYRDFYLPIYKAIRDKGMLQPFMYTILKSTPSENVKKWNKKNDKAVKEYFNYAGAQIRNKRGQPIFADGSGFEQGTPGWHKDNGELTAIGRQNANGKKIGPWVYFYETRERSSEGSFKDDVKTGSWKYYREDGTLQRIENYENGEVTYFHPNGEKYQHFFLVADEIDGIAEVYYTCGALEQKISYKAGKRHGAAKDYYPDGRVRVEYNYDNGEFDGPYKTYYPTGQLQMSFQYKKGNLDGAYTKYHPNGQIEMEAIYVNGEAEGKWRYFYFNGKPDRTGVYKKNNAVGEWLFYDERGTLIEKRNFGDAEKLNGNNTFYSADGKLHYVVTYNNDIPVSYVYYDASGKEISRAGKDNGTYNLKTYYSTGELGGEGNLKDGKRDGLWKFYHRTGQIASEFNYRDGSLQGVGTEYFLSGVKKSEANYVDNELNGYYREFYTNGNVSLEGWCENGDRQQQWLSYRKDGKVDADEYYLNGTLVGKSINYAPDGKIESTRTDKDGLIEDFAYYNQAGALTSSVEKENGKTVVMTRFSNSTPQSRIELICGKYYGDLKRWYPDGKPYYQYAFLDGKRHGKYLLYDLTGDVSHEGTYIDGWSEGQWKSYEDGKLDYTGYYLNNRADSMRTYYTDGKPTFTISYLRDERDGITTIYTTEGEPTVEKLYRGGDLISYRSKDKSGAWTNWQKFTGEAVIVGYHSNGTKAYEEDYKNGLFNSYRREFFPDGKLQSEYGFSKGDYSGPFTVYYRSGKIRSKGRYEYDELHGKVEYFAENGKLMREENWHHGERFGKTIIYKNGVKEKEVTYWSINVYE